LLSPTSPLGRSCRNLFTGWYDAKLTDLGRNEALSGAKSLIANGQTEFDIAFTSDLSRAQDTCKIILTELGLDGKIEVKKDEALNERNYGDLTGLNKDDAKAKWGAEQVVRSRLPPSRPSPLFGPQARARPSEYRSPD
jgi:2,3-bisphosphoglycerate-dependent phosphoglycerate mutase